MAYKEKDMRPPKGADDVARERKTGTMNNMAATSCCFSIFN